MEPIIFGNTLCTDPVSLILVGDEFKPVWRMKRRIENGRICVELPPETTILRVGRGWRKGNDKYYLLNISKNEIIKLKKIPVKRVEDGSWYIRLESPTGEKWIVTIDEKKRMRVQKIT